MGQRGAANATRSEFRLEKFSHSTVSRSFKALERSQKQCLERRFGAEGKANSGETPTIVATAARRGNEKSDGVGVGTATRFPVANDTIGRREAMSEFLREIPSGAKGADMEAASRLFAEKWHEKTKRLLL